MMKQGKRSALMDSKPMTRRSLEGVIAVVGFVGTFISIDETKQTRGRVPDIRRPLQTWLPYMGVNSSK
jgi:hypothetical protein